MRIFFLVFSILSFIFSALHIYPIITGAYSTLFPPNIAAIISSIGAGLVYLILWIRKYEGEWATIIGLLMIVIGVSAFGGEINKFINEADYNDIFGICVSLLFIVFGILLLISGHKLHRHKLRIMQLQKDYISKQINEQINT